MENKLLKVNIQKELKEFDLDVSFELKSRSLGILGPSGCGKSMTLKSIAGIVDPDKGIVSLSAGEETVFFDSDKKINIKPQKRNVGYLFQNYALFPNMTVEENVACGLPKDDKKTVSEMIERFHLNGLEKRYPRQLSGGQQQRVALARILAYGPDVILLDEPFSAMDTFLKEQLRIKIQERFRLQGLPVVRTFPELKSLMTIISNHWIGELFSKYPKRFHLTSLTSE